MLYSIWQEDITDMSWGMMYYGSVNSMGTSSGCISATGIVKESSYISMINTLA